MHTLWSDRSASIQEMAEAAEERGYEYIAITDHSKGLKIAGVINEEQMEQQGNEIGGREYQPSKQQVVPFAFCTRLKSI